MVEFVSLMLLLVRLALERFCHASVVMSHAS